MAADLDKREKGVQARQDALDTEASRRVDGQVRPQRDQVELRSTKLDEREAELQEREKGLENEARDTVERQCVSDVSELDAREAELEGERRG